MRTRSLERLSDLPKVMCSSWHWNSGLCSWTHPLLSSNELPHKVWISPTHKYNTAFEGLWKIFGIYGLYLEILFVFPVTKSFFPSHKTYQAFRVPQELLSRLFSGGKRMERYCNKTKLSLCLLSVITQTSDTESDREKSRCFTSALSDTVANNHMWLLTSKLMS